MRRVVAAAALGVWASLGAPPPVAAQEAANLERVEELVRAGRTEEARADLLRWWSEAYPEAGRLDRQRALWLRGRLTVDPVQAGLDFRRLIVEFPGGMFSDRAMLRLAQSAWASGDDERARGFVDRLARDYPTSSVRRQAEEWLAHAGRAMAAARQAAPDTSAQDVVAEPPPPAEVPRDEAPAAEAPPSIPPPVAGRYSIQLGAFASEERARAHLDRVTAAGYEGRLVRVEGSRLIRVRVGRFDDSAAADDLLRDVQRHGFVAVVVRDAQKEERVRVP